MIGRDSNGVVHRLWWTDVDSGCCYTKMNGPGLGDRIYKHTLSEVEGYAVFGSGTVWDQRLSPEFFEWLPDQ